jgi:hypothetical protein
MARGAGAGPKLRPGDLVRVGDLVLRVIKPWWGADDGWYQVKEVFSPGVMSTILLSPESDWELMGHMED